MKVLVAGGAGFIGSNLCHRLLDEGKEVICVDDLSSGRQKVIDELRDRDDFRFVQHDITEPLELDTDVDRIYHLASRASPPDYQDHPIHTLRTNAEGTFNMLNLAAEHDAALLYSSTSEVYGDPEIHPQTEDYNGNVNPIGPRACYDESKRYAEAMIVNYVEQHDVDASIVRIFNTYGPRMKPDDGRVITNFLKQVLRDDPITVYGDGSQTRSFCYIDDLLDGLQLVMEDGDRGPYNLGNPDERTILELAELVQEHFDTSSEIVHKDLPEDDPERRRPDISRVRELGWDPGIDLATGLQETATYLEEREL